MSHRWEYEDEYLQLRLALNRAKREGNITLIDELEARIKIFDDMLWLDKTEHFPELAAFSSVVEALEYTAERLRLPFPDLTNPQNRTGDGMFLFGISDGRRSIQIWPMQDRKYYSIEVFDYTEKTEGDCYRGHTQSLDAATQVLSLWFVARCSIAVLHAQYPWMDDIPFRLTEPRMTFE